MRRMQPGIEIALAAAVLITVTVHDLAAADAETIVVQTDFDGGSARVIEIDQQSRFIRIMPAGDPNRGWPAWWYCRVGGLTEGQRVSLNVVPSSRIIPEGHPGAGKPLAGSWALPDRATWSADNREWQQTSPGERGDAGITYELISPGRELYVAWGPPATPTLMNAWIDELATNYDFVSDIEVAKTIEHRRVRGVRIAAGDTSAKLRPVVWLHARQHAWESGSSWVARGVGKWIVGDSADAIWLRENTLTFIVPIMDVDRAATGDGGKESSPHDHNRDWSDAPHYPEVAAVQTRIKQWTDEDRMAVFVDLHNPGPGDARAFFYVAPDEAIDASRKPRRSRFLDTIQANWDAPIPLDRRTRSTGPKYHPLWQRISSTWVTGHGNESTIAVCLETSWNTPHSTTEGYNNVGACLGTGISRFLQAERVSK